MRRLRLQVLVLLAVLVLGACGDDTEETGDDGAASGAVDESDGAENDASTTVAVTDSALGEILVDGDGMTLYLFTNDDERKSNCAGSCAQTWPPLLADGEVEAGSGVDEALLTTFDRDDGSKQVAYNGAPLYHYTPDEAAGDTKGQGVGGVWYVVGKDGEAIKEAAGAGTPSY